MNMFAPWGHKAGFQNVEPTVFSSLEQRFLFLAERPGHLPSGARREARSRSRSPWRLVPREVDVPVADESLGR